MAAQLTQSNPSLRDEINERVEDEARDGWLLRRRLSPDARRASLQAVFFNGQPGWRSAFGGMLALAAGVAALGLSQDSAATVIGSMIIAPLGQPIVALGAALALTWPRQIGNLSGIILAGATGVIAIAYSLGVLLPDATPNAQMLARTAPDLRDLGVALFAGAAGAFAYTRDELSGVLPGVAIAVALVPPLAVVGLMLEQGHTLLAQGALTLFLTNLVGIALAAAVVMLVTRWAPLPSLRSRAPGVLAGLAGMVLAAGLLCVPLGRSYAAAVSQAQTATTVTAAVADSVGSTGPTLGPIQIDGNSVTVPTSSPGDLDEEAVQSVVGTVLGPDASVTVEAQ
ncbi:DUF389 domain-containing protein [Euzebya tangerina]|uniref:DUF389 domain-containing protein n=1 Tax=Euzebya tangerina TaxID=591198 RepID=UPI000E324766|nr:DUF389 domain-containing protein [Euzebya tangerina]